MSKCPSTQVNIPVLFDAGDMQDAHSLAACDLRWMESALAQIKSSLESLAETYVKNCPVISAELSRLADHAEMYVYLADHRRDVHDQLADEYKEQFEGNKDIKND